MKNKIFRTIGIITGLILIIGIISAILLNIFMPMNFSCTDKMCNPQAHEGYSEVSCNFCGGKGVYLFYTGLINFKKMCPGKQIMIFQNGELIGERIEVAKCEHVLHVLR